MRAKIEVKRSVGKSGDWLVENWYWIDGVKVTKRKYDKALPDAEPLPPLRVTAGKRPWPMESVAMGVHPDQIPEATQAYKNRGLNVGFTPDGNAIIADRDTRRKMLKVNQLHDRNGGYGDG